MAAAAVAAWMVAAEPSDRCGKGSFIRFAINKKTYEKKKMTRH